MKHTIKGKFCKFALDCKQQSCSFVHPLQFYNQQCRFGNRCSNYKCQFNHPGDWKFHSIPCRDADVCIDKKCNFLHPGQARKCRNDALCTNTECSAIHPFGWTGNPKSMVDRDIIYSAGILPVRFKDNVTEVLLPYDKWEDEDGGLNILGGKRTQSDTSPDVTAARRTFEEIKELIPQQKILDWLRGCDKVYLKVGKYLIFIGYADNEFSDLPEKFDELEPNPEVGTKSLHWVPWEELICGNKASKGKKEGLNRTHPPNKDTEGKNWLTTQILTRIIKDKFGMYDKLTKIIQKVIKDQSITALGEKLSLTTIK